jgi:hypothetical protein
MELLSSKAIAANRPDKVISKSSVVRVGPNVRWNHAFKIEKESSIGLEFRWVGRQHHSPHSKPQAIQGRRERPEYIMPLV